MQSNYHYTVMKDEAIESLLIKDDGVYVDATLGMGGHSLGILEINSNLKKIICIDNDMESIEIAKKRLSKYDQKIEFICGNFKNIHELISEKVDGIIVDLGLSTYQILNSKRGFSFNDDSKLDMRINLNQKLTAHEIVNTFSVTKLSELLKDFGEERNHYKIASEIARERNKKEIKNSIELSNIVEKINKNISNINPSTRTFQALRIAVNDELPALSEFLVNSIKVLKKGARLIIITFHSLEDRIVKRFFKLCESECICPPSKMICDCEKEKTLKIITRKPISPSKEEVAENPSSRSAKMRVGMTI